jgi:hypothetical protein
MRRALTILTLSFGLLAFPGTALAYRDRDRASAMAVSTRFMKRFMKRLMANIIGNRATTTESIRRKNIAIGSPPIGILTGIIMSTGASVASIERTRATESCAGIIMHPITIATGAIIGAIIEVINTATTSMMTITWSG